MIEKLKVALNVTGRWLQHYKLFSLSLSLSYCVFLSFSLLLGLSLFFSYCLFFSLLLCLSFFLSLCLSLTL